MSSRGFPHCLLALLVFFAVIALGSSLVLRAHYGRVRSESGVCASRNVYRGCCAIAKRFGSSSRQEHVQLFGGYDMSTPIARRRVPRVLADLSSMSAAEAMEEVVGDTSDMPAEQRFQIGAVTLLPNPPTINRYVAACPKALHDNSVLAKQHGIDFSSMDPQTPLASLSSLLPLIYIADVHQEYGTLGFALHRPVIATMREVMPEHRCFRDRPVYEGGAQKAGSAFTMLHRRQGFPDNRALRFLPQEFQHRLFFSPDVAMANELVSTGDAAVREFRFFQWATIWRPNQLTYEWDQGIWHHLEAPADVLFEDTPSSYEPLWRRLLGLIPS